MRSCRHAPERRPTRTERGALGFAMRSRRGSGGCGRVSEHKASWDVQTPMDTVAVELEFCRALQGLGDEFGNHQRAKPLALRRTYGRPTFFNPLKIKAAVGLRTAPSHQHPSLGGGKRTMLVSVGDKLMQGKADVLHGIGAEEQSRTVQLRARTGTEQIKMRPHQVAQPSALPVLAQHKVLRLRQALNALAELLHELFDRRALACGLQSHPLHHRELVLRAMREFAHQKGRMLMPDLEFRSCRA